LEVWSNKGYKTVLVLKLQEIMYFHSEI